MPVAFISPEYCRHTGATVHVPVGSPPHAAAFALRVLQVGPVPEDPLCPAVAPPELPLDFEPAWLLPPWELLPAELVAELPPEDDEVERPPEPAPPDAVD
jgi:hypothetical protein